MSKSEILYVKGMNVSESEGDDGDNDIWDDRKLNDAYDKALRIANAEVAKRVAMSTNTQNKNKEGQPNKKKGKPITKDAPVKGNKSQNTQWKAGMPCRAIYEADGIEYEAVILRIITDNECVVKYLGYGNAEVVSISTLKPSLGKDEQARQIQEALEEDKTDEAYTSLSPNMDKMECVSDTAPTAESTEQTIPRKKKTGKKKKNQNAKVPNGFEMPNGFGMPQMPFPMPNMSALRNLGPIDMPLPPPPPGLGSRGEGEEQAVSSMLLSWYMSGYYTGLYQGLKRAKENRSNV
ncbi:survival motor neuron protein [Ostrinia furnacalis]|uniref:survival motor neuron protein n=1 Tax=Ostrinia furnacalis TaxID=93504 RepID=UPI00103ACFCB|nr:survival motor neuron protein [Ostrinia furnacalis]